MHLRALVDRPDVGPLDHSHLWLVALLTFGLGDVATTALGLGVDGVAEASPVVAPLIGQHGLVALVALKAAVFAVAFGLWTVVPRPERDGIPIGLAVIGAPVTVWNLAVVGVAVLG